MKLTKTSHSIWEDVMKKNIVMSLKKNTSPGPDNISTRDLIVLYPIIKDHLLFLVNKSIKSIIFSKLCKIARITPVFKKGNKEEPANYRLISNTSIFAKIIEKLMKKRLAKFLEISKHQYGFQEKSSTEGAAIDVIKHILQKLDEKKKVVGVFIDLHKAFDTIDIAILLNKLKRIGIQGKALKLF